MRDKIHFASVLLLLVVLTTALAAAPESKPAAPAPKAETPTTAASPDPVPPSHVVRVYYFHTTARCVTCRKIEALAGSAINAGFPQDLKEGRLVWSVANIEEPENRHFIKDYQLYTKSVVVVDTLEGKQTRWKNLPKIWQLVRDEAAFTRYVQDEVRGYLEGRT